MVTGLKVETEPEIIAAANVLRGLGPHLAVITLGTRGSCIASSEGTWFIPAFPVTAVDTTAAGDIFCGSFATALAEGRQPADAIRFASAASAISVTRMGAQPSAPTRNEIESFLSAKA